MATVYNLRASMISRVVGTDPYCSRQRYFSILIGDVEEKPVNQEYVEHGIYCEGYGIAEVMKHTKMIVKNCGIGDLGEQINTEADYIRNDEDSVILSCTPDGYIGDKDLVEVKAPYFVQDNPVEYIQKYLPQIYFQQYLTGKQGTYACVYQMNNPKVMYIPKNEKYLHEFMLPKIFEFASYLLKGKLDSNFKTKRTHKKSFIYEGELDVQIT